MELDKIKKHWRNYELDLEVMDLILNFLETKASFFGCKSPNTKRDITLLN